jgi:hypothetical protein
MAERDRNADNQATLLDKRASHRDARLFVKQPGDGFYPSHGYFLETE